MLYMMKGCTIMRKKRISLLAMVLAIVMLAGVLAACGGPAEQTTEKEPAITTEKTDIVTTEAPSSKPTEEATTETPTEPTEPTEPADTEEPTETTTEEPTAETETEVTPKIESPYIDTIVKANKLANGVQQFYSGVTRWFSNNGQICYIENQEIDLAVLRDNATKDQYISYLRNKDGGTYIENTMDVYIRMHDGSVYYTSKTTNDSYTNVYRHGFYYHEIRMERLNFANDAGERIESLQVARIFHTYPDKLHHEIQVCSADVKTQGIEAIGFITEIAADKVARIQVKDKNGTHDTLDGVDWDSVEYVGFDIIEAGIFGYILPVHENTGSIIVTLEDGKYVITQEKQPNDGTIQPGNSEVLNGNDFYMGQRLYTDTTHDFAVLETEAYIERNPLTAKNVKISTANSDGAVFSGYDALRGSYIINMDYEANNPWSKRQNKHFEANFSIKGDSYDRTVYMVFANDGGILECAVVLDEDLMSLPIPVQVGKNFSGDGDDKNQNVQSDSNVSSHNIFNFADSKYSEAIFPIVVKAGDLKEYSVIHMYQNWGNFPLKQISFIHFYVPYYHFSTGLTETNCICYNATNVDMLPDHRAMSAPYWPEGIQHTSGGWHGFFQFKYSPKDSEQALKNTERYITSYGPTYAEIDMMFESTDGNIKATYTHMEMPQTDENRAYYTMTYEFVEDTDFKAFKANTRLYFVRSRDSSGIYQKLGFLGQDNLPCIVDMNSSGETVYHTLGDECPYFDLFYMPTYFGNGGPGYVNVGFLIKDYEVTIGGEKSDARLVLKEENNSVALTLDLDNVRFKKGDTIKINAIIMPWGSQESDYSGENYAADQNVRDVRENTLLNPMTIIAGENTEVVEDTFVPKVRSTNGTSAEFTLSGGKKNSTTIKNRDSGYNITVRAYGFTKLTAPKVYELVNGEWVAYELSSINTPDTLGYTNMYDGYAVYYDEDGTVSYSFVVDMSEGEDRTFKIDTDYTFGGFARIETTEKVLHPYKFILESSQVASVARKYPMFSAIKAGDYSGMSYVSLHGTNSPSTLESWVSINQNELSGAETGQYIIIKYRLPEDNPDLIDFLMIFTSTVYSGATGPDYFRVSSGIEPDGKWHLLVLDTQGMMYLIDGKGDYVSPDVDGKYFLNYIRVDLFKRNVDPQTHWDIAFIATHDDLQTIYEANSDMEYITLVSGEYITKKIDPKTGTEIQ